MTTTSDVTVAVIGLGYIGLPTAAVLAVHGLDVIGVDVNPETVDAVNRGEVPFVEPDLAASVIGAVTQGRLKAQVETPEADVFIVAVPTPFAADHAADLSYIDAATDGLVPHLRGGELIILESTSPPGTTRHMAERILLSRPDLHLGTVGAPQIYVAHCPERVLPGRVMIELITNDRIVGGLTRESAERAKALYMTFCRGEIMVTDALTAELAKLVENSYRDINIAFANELSGIAQHLSIDVWELIDLANHHPRVNILRPGPGVGGHCIAVDPWFIVSAAPEHSKLIRTAREINDARPGQIVGEVMQAAEKWPAPRIAALGLAFKADIDDLRESPARLIVERIARELPAATLSVVEPNIDRLPSELAELPNVHFETLEKAIGWADVVVLLVDHIEFKITDRTKLGLASKTIIDTRGIWSWDVRS